MRFLCSVFLRLGPFKFSDVTFTAILVILEEFEGHSGVSKMKLKIAFFLLDKFIIKNKLEIRITYGYKC